MIVRNENIQKFLNYCGKQLHAPEQRLILGATALATQPFIDLNNKDVDKKTRLTSVARTIAKIIAGTLVGVLVRKAGINFVKKYSQYEKILDPKTSLVTGVIGKKGKDLFVPLFAGKNKFKPIKPEDLEKKFNLYIKAMGTFAATIAMVFTNFILDAPLTKWLTGLFNKIIDKTEKAKSAQGKAGEN